MSKKSKEFKEETAEEKALDKAWKRLKSIKPQIEKSILERKNVPEKNENGEIKNKLVVKRLDKKYFDETWTKFTKEQTGWIEDHNGNKIKCGTFLAYEAVHVRGCKVIKPEEKSNAQRTEPAGMAKVESKPNNTSIGNSGRGSDSDS